MKNSTKMVALTTLILSTLMILSSENWFSMWMGLEINMMSFIPLIQKTKSMSSSQSKMTYFMIQSLGSIMLIFTMISNPMMMKSEMFLNEMTTIIITLSMMLKMGAAPLHSWFIYIMNKMDWDMCLMLMTWQKIGPLFVLSNLNNNNNMIMIISMMSAMMGAIGGLNQTSLKKIMAFSSVNHMGWMMMSIKFDNEVWMKYWMIYSIIVIMLTINFNKNSTQYINQMNMNISNKMEKINLIILMMSLGGLPPMIGFLPKWMVIESLIKNNCLIELFIITMCSMITLFYYIRMITPMIMINNSMNKWNIKKNNKLNMHIMEITINMMLPLALIMNMI